MTDDQPNHIEFDVGSMGREPVRWGFGTPGPLREKLTALAIAGGKVVTTDLWPTTSSRASPWNSRATSRSSSTRTSSPWR